MFCAASDWQSERSGSSGLEEERDWSQLMFGSESWMKKCASTVKCGLPSQSSEFSAEVCRSVCVLWGKVLISLSLS